MTDVLDPALGVLDYDALVEAYHASLFAVLRHHTSDFLDTWVPDDDPARSILNMVEAAEIAGYAQLAVRVGPESRARLATAALLASIAPLGQVTVEEDGDAAIIRVSGIGGRSHAAVAEAGPDPFAKVAPAYRFAVRAAAGTIAYEGTASAAGATTVSAGESGLRLSAAIDPQHVIRAASHAGATSRIERAVFDRLCAILTDLPVQDAHDHAAIKLEAALRDPQAPPPVAGIVHAEHADPIFVRPARLVRELVAAYAKESGFRLGTNTFARKPSQAWLALTADGKVERLRTFLSERIEALGLESGQAEIVDVDRVIRVTVGFREDVPVAVKPPFLMRLERALHEIEPALQVFSIELKDANKIRRL